MKFCKPSVQMLTWTPCPEGTSSGHCWGQGQTFGIIVQCIKGGHLHDNKPMFQMGIHLETSGVAHLQGQSQYVVHIFGKSTSRM